MKSNSKPEAWKIVDGIFPTDYMRNDRLSMRAGYPIYTSTSQNCNAWISDVGCALEVNLENGKSIRINY